MTDSYREWDAAYVLGMLSPEDRRSFERHLERCDGCRSAVAELAGMPGILAAIPADEALALLTPDEPTAEHPRESPLSSLATVAVRQRRRTRRWMTAAALGFAAVVALIAFAIGGTVARAPLSATAPSSAAVVMTPVLADSITADLTVTAKKWGTRLDWDCSYPRDWSGRSPSSYDLVVTDLTGHETVVGTWTAYGTKASQLSASTSIATRDIRFVDIRLSGSAQTLARTTLAS